LEILAIDLIGASTPKNFALRPLLPRCARWFEGPGVETNFAKRIRTNDQGSLIALTDSQGALASISHPLTVDPSTAAPSGQSRLNKTDLSRTSKRCVLQT